MVWHMKQKVLFLGWVGDQARVRAMADYWNFEVVFIASMIKSQMLKPLDYLMRIPATLLALYRFRGASAVWIQCPPTVPALVFLVIFGCSTNRPKLLLDFHNSMLRSKWWNLPFSKFMLRRADLVVAHNHVVRRYLEESLPGLRTIALEDKPFEFEAARTHDPEIADNHGAAFRVIFPASGDSDEPFEEVISAAALVPGLTLYITGGAAKAKYRGRNYKNVEFTGYLPSSDYWALLGSADAVLALTQRQDVQLSSANEGASLRKILVITGSPLLRELYPYASSYVGDHRPESIASAINFASQNRVRLAAESDRLYSFRAARWLSQASDVERVILGGSK